jgi:ketosteroid isomerase-like protein
MGTSVGMIEVHHGALIDRRASHRSSGWSGRLEREDGRPDTIGEVAVADHPNLATFSSIYAAFTTGDMNRLAAFFDEDVVWHTPGKHPLAGTHEGRSATFASFAEEFERSNGSYSVDVRDVLASDEHVVALLHATADREGKRLDQDYAIVFYMSDGKVNAAWEVWRDQRLVDEFWS